MTIGQGRVAGLQGGVRSLQTSQLEAQVVAFCCRLCEVLLERNRLRSG